MVQVRVCTRHVFTLRGAFLDTLGRSELPSPPSTNPRYLLDEAAADSWAQCGKQEREDNKWEVVLEAKVDGEVAEDEPNTERVAWAAFNQGAFETSSGIKSAVRARWRACSDYSS